MIKKNLPSFKGLPSVVFCLLVICLLALSCQKDGKLIVPPAVTSASIEIKGATPAAKYLVYLDDVQIGDTIKNGTKGIVGLRVSKKEASQRLLIKDLTNQSTFLDTVMVLPAPSFSFLLLQINKGEKPVIFSGNEQETPPGKDSVKMRFIYSDQRLPDSIRIRFYYINPDDFTTTALGAAIVKRNQPGPFVTGTLKKYSNDITLTIYGIDISNAKTGVVIQPLNLDFNSPRFGEGVMDQAPLSSGSLITKKQTLLLEYGTSSFLSDVFKERYLIGSNE